MRTSMKSSGSLRWIVMRRIATILLFVPAVLVMAAAQQQSRRQAKG